MAISPQELRIAITTKTEKQTPTIVTGRLSLPFQFKRFVNLNLCRLTLLRVTR